MAFVGKITPGSTVDLFAYDADGDLWNGSAYVTPPLSAADPMAYRVAVTEKGDGRAYATLPADAATYELRERAATYGTSYVVWVGTVESGGTGSGDVPVTHATLDDDGDTMTVVDGDGNGVDDAAVRAYVTADYTANPATAPVRAETRTLSDGTWAAPLMLGPGAYTVTFHKSGYSLGSTTLTVEA